MFTQSANLTKWSNTLKQFVLNLPKNCLSVFDHVMGLTLKGLKKETYPRLGHYSESCQTSKMERFAKRVNG